MTRLPPSAVAEIRARAELDPDDLDRVEMMAAGHDKWDLSPNDLRALKALLADRAALVAEVERLTGLVDKAMAFLVGRCVEVHAIVDDDGPTGWQVLDMEMGACLTHAMEWDSAPDLDGEVPPETVFSTSAEAIDAYARWRKEQETEQP